MKTTKYDFTQFENEVLIPFLVFLVQMMHNNAWEGLNKSKVLSNLVLPTFIFLDHYLCPKLKTDMIRIGSMCGLCPGSDRHDFHMWSWSRENKTHEGSADVRVFFQTSKKCIRISWLRNIRTTTQVRSRVSGLLPGNVQLQPI